MLHVCARVAHNCQWFPLKFPLKFLCPVRLVVIGDDNHYYAVQILCYHDKGVTSKSDSEIEGQEMSKPHRQLKGSKRQLGGTQR